MSAADPYPPHWEFDTVLGDGGTTHVRPILPADAEALQRFHARLSRETRYYRFFSPKSELTAAEVERFTTVDHVDRVALIALDGDEIIAVARYDRLPDPEADDAGLGDHAEVAFTVDDAHQGRGLGTLMLEYLAAAGREHGVRRFVAETMPDNRRMIAVFHAAGYRTTDRFVDGMVEVEFPIDATDTARDAVRAREHRAEARSIARVLNPSSVVVIGPHEVPGSAARVVGEKLERFVGEVHRVERPEDLAGLDLPADLAVVADATGDVGELVAACADHGANAVVVVGGVGPEESGEAGQGGDAAGWESGLLAAARRRGLRLVGPDSIGLANTALALDATVAPVLPSAGRIGVMVDAGPVAIRLLSALAERGLGISSFVSAGRKLDVSGNDLLQYWEDDAATDLVLLHLESFGNPRKFARIARRVGARTPVVAVWPGGAPGQEAADRAVDGLFHQAGVVRVWSIDEMVDVASVILDPDAVVPAAARAAAARHAAWRGRDRELPSVPDDVDGEAAFALVEAVLAEAAPADLAERGPVWPVTPGPTADAVLAAYGIVLDDAPASDVDTTRMAVAIVQDPVFGPLVSIGSGAPPTIVPAEVRLVPLTGRDAAELAAAVMPDPPPELEDLLVRLGLLAADLETVDELVLDPVVAGPRGVTVGAVALRVRPVAPHLPDLVRRLGP